MINPELGYDNAANWSLIPMHMVAGMRRYLTHGIAPGHFLKAVLSNDLMEALGRADEENQRSLPAYGRFLYNYAASSSYGSPERFEAWVKGGGAQGMLKNDL